MSWNWYEDGDSGGYVSAGARRKLAEAAARKLEKKGRKLSPVRVTARSIANTFWGQAWCRNLESYSDYDSRLPRGRSYVRNGSVLDLQIERGVIKALVSGQEVYHVTIKIDALDGDDWRELKQECLGKLGSLIDLLQGKLSGPVMEIITRKDGGLFPEPSEIDLKCSCPDHADMCKHVAATLYGVGVRLDESPELLFTLRGVDHLELIAETTQNLSEGLTASAGATDTLDESSLSEVFGIELEPLAKANAPKLQTPTRPATKTTVPKPPAAARKQPTDSELLRALKIELQSRTIKAASKQTAKPPVKKRASRRG